MDLEKFSLFISNRRRELGMTQKQLADRLNVTNKAVSKWETAKGFPDVSLLEPLAEALGVSVVELMHGEKIEMDRASEEAAAKAVSDALALADLKHERREFIVAAVVISALAAVVIALGFYFPSAPTVWTLPFIFCSVTGLASLFFAVLRHSRGKPCALLATVSGVLLTVTVLQVVWFLVVVIGFSGMAGK